MGGIKQLRENIAESKLSYEIMDDAAQVFLKSKIMDNIHKYYFLIAFTAYMREAAELARNAATEEAKANCSGRGTSLPRPWPTSSLSPRRTSRPTWAESSTTSTRRRTQCSRTCHRATTRSAPSIGLPRRP